MDLSKLAEALGLPKDAKPEAVFAAAAAAVAEGLEARKQIEGVHTALTAKGLKLEGGTVVALAAPSTEPKPEDDAEKTELRQRLAALETANAKQRLSAAREEAEQLVKSGKLPPAVQVELSALLAVTGQVESLSLSADGATVVRKATDIAGHIRKIVAALPGIKPAEGLSQLPGVRPTDANGESKPDDLRKKGMSLARLASGKKESAAAK